jgi:hypothetical protein
LGVLLVVTIRFSDLDKPARGAAAQVQGEVLLLIWKKNRNQLVY